MKMQVVAVSFIFLMTGFANARDAQVQLKEDILLQVQDAAARHFMVEASSVEVNLGDRRLVIPQCSQAMAVTFPFDDRSTSKIVCLEPKWTGYVQIKLQREQPAFLFQRELPKGYVLTRGDVIRRLAGTIDDDGTRVVSISDVLNKPLIKDVTSGTVLVYEQFADESDRDETAAPIASAAGWIAKTTITRGARLSAQQFDWQLIPGRVPTDTIPKNADLAIFEANRHIMPGETLRRSVIQLAPAVRKGDQIKVIVQRGVLTVATTLIALEDGNVADNILVVNQESGRELRAIVTDVGTLELL
ncbi:flagellar basal body P-ring formation chaperone FlgA [Luminiphilus sp.]|nr:flagellar basal body P-ring formation chaperone FlgA [Luminiphilus sp.]